MTHPLPQNWQSVKLGTVGKVSMCKRILKNQTSTSGDIPFYKIGTFGKEPDAFISEKIYNEFKEKYSFPKKGEILISAAGTIGRTVIYDGIPAYFQDSNIVWLSNNEKQILNSFLAHAYKRVRWNTSSGTIARLYNDNIKEIELSLPPLPEQRRIVAVLETWDKTIEKLERKIELKKNVKKGLMQKLLTGKMRLPGFTKEWKRMQLGTVVQFFKGKGLSKSEIVEAGQNPCIRYGELYTHYSETIDEILSFTNLSPSTMMTSAKNDVIIPASGETDIDIATAACVLLDGVILGGDLNILRGDINGIFLSYYLNNVKRIAIAGLAQGDSVVHLYPSQLSKLLIELPNKKEQEAIASVLTSSDRVIELQQAKLNILKAQKNYLLNHLVTGRIRTPENLSIS